MLETVYKNGRGAIKIRRDGGVVWSTRTGKVKISDGTVYDAELSFCDSDGGEHYGTVIFLESGPVSQDQPDFLTRLGKTKNEVYPYRYKYEGFIDGDHHVGVDGWSR